MERHTKEPKPITSNQGRSEIVEGSFLNPPFSSLKKSKIHGSDLVKIDPSSVNLHKGCYYLY